MIDLLLFIVMIVVFEFFCEYVFIGIFVILSYNCYVFDLYELGSIWNEDFVFVFFLNLKSVKKINYSCVCMKVKGILVNMVKW